MSAAKRWADRRFGNQSALSAASEVPDRSLSWLQDIGVVTSASHVTRTGDLPLSPHSASYQRADYTDI
jgi:hypothetical protein